MNLIINKRDSKSFDTFIRTQLDKTVATLILKCLDKGKLEVIDSEFNIDSLKILKLACNNIKMTENDNSYSIAFDRNKKLNGVSISNWMDLITYGNRSVQGYPLVYNIFEYVAKHIDDLYRVWRMKRGY